MGLDINSYFLAQNKWTTYLSGFQRKKLKICTRLIQYSWFTLTVIVSWERWVLAMLLLNQKIKKIFTY